MRRARPRRRRPRAQAISILAILRTQNHEAYDLFNKFDADGSGHLKKDELLALLTALNEGAAATEADVAYVLKQVEGGGGLSDLGLSMAQLKPAIACWYMLVEHNVPEDDGDAPPGDAGDGAAAAPTNQAFVFVKPHANTEATRKLVKETLAA